MMAPSAAGWTQDQRRAARQRRTLALAGGIAGAVLVIVAAVAIVVAAVAAPAARRALDFGFAGLPATAGEALGIFAHNVRMLLGAVGLLAIAQAPLHAGLRPGRALLGLRCAGELLIAGIAAANLLVVGAALGAYGSRMIVALWPHGPLELAAYSLALALYAHARHAPVGLGQAGTVLACCVTLLAGAAALEVFAAP